MFTLKMAGGWVPYEKSYKDSFLQATKLIQSISDWLAMDLVQLLMYVFGSSMLFISLKHYHFVAFHELC